MATIQLKQDLEISIQDQCGTFLHEFSVNLFENGVLEIELEDIKQDPQVFLNDVELSGNSDYFWKDGNLHIIQDFTEVSKTALEMPLDDRIAYVTQLQAELNSIQNSIITELYELVQDEKSVSCI